MIGPRVGCAIVVAATLLACGKKAGKVRLDDATPVLTADEQCTEMLEVLWASIQDKLVETGIDPETPWWYLEEPTFLKRCAELTDAQRSCIVDADDPVMGIHDCGVNRGRQFAHVLQAPKIRSLLDEGPELPADEQAARLKQLVGEWRGTMEGHPVTWRVARDGSLDQTVGGETDRYRVGLEHDGRISLETESGGMNYVFLQVAKPSCASTTPSTSRRGRRSAG